MKFKRLTALLTAIIVTVIPLGTFAAEYSGTDPKNESWYRLVERDRLAVAPDATSEMITVSVNGSKLNFLNAPFIDGGEIMLPAKEFFEKLGFFIGWRERTRDVDWCGSYYGEVNGALVSIIPDDDVSYYDDVPLELGKKTVAGDNEVFVPLYYFQFVNGLDIAVENKADVKMTFAKRTVEVEEEEEIDAEEVLKDYEGETLISWERCITPGVLGVSGKTTAKVVDVNENGFDKAIEVENLSRPTVSYENQIGVDSTTRLNIGDVCLFTAWIRHTYCVDESGFGTVAIVLEENGNGFTKVLDTSELTVSNEWKKLVFPFVSNRALEPGKAGLRVRVGFNYQTIQLANVNIINYGKQVSLSELGLTSAEDVVKPESYRGQEDDALWREEALRRIEKYRKSPITVKVTDENGNPVPGAKVNLDMTRNEFIFGSEIGAHATGDTGRKREYLDGYRNFFNGFVWGNEFKPPTTETTIQQCIDTANFARDNNLYVRGHTFIYDYPFEFGGYTQDEIDKMSYDEFYDLYMRMCSWREAVLGDYIAEYDLFNEPYDWQHTLPRLGLGVMIDIIEGVNELIDDQVRFINTTGESGQIGENGGLDFGKYKSSQEVVQKIADEGAEFDGYGMQAHTSAGSSPVELYLQLDGHARRFGACAVTEYDYKTDVGDTYQEKQSVQAKYLRDALITTYSQPQATGFTMWAYTTYHHGRNDGPLADSQLHPKDEPMHYWNELVLGEWMPHELGTTDENGIYNIRTHRGEFDVTVTVGNKIGKTTLKSTADGENTVIATVGKNGIDMQSSEKVVTLAERTEPLNYDKARLNAHNYQLEFKKLSESLAESAVSEDGRDLAFLIDDTNENPWMSSESDNSVVIELSETRKKGYAAIDWYGEDSIYRLEASSDGINWTKFAGCEGVGHTYDRFDGENIKYIRLSSADGKTITPCRIRVFPVEFYARQK